MPRRSGARTVDLTSRPDREDGQPPVPERLGFEQRETNVYRRTLETGDADDSSES